MTENKLNLASDRYAVNWLQQVSRKAAGEIRWIGANGLGALAIGVNADLLGEGSVRQCKHCQKLKQYVPGSGTLWGYCYNCDGYLCDKAVCLKMCYPARQQAEDVFLAAGIGPTGKQIEALVRRQAWREAVYA